MNKSSNIIICKDAKSPFWIAQFNDPQGKRVRRSTKVPVAGGMFNGERLNARQAENRARQEALKIAEDEEKKYDGYDNRTVRELFDMMLSGKLGRVSLATYDNARTDYRNFCKYLGARADQPARFITRADMKAWVTATRKEVRCKTCLKALTAINSAFNWAVDAEILTKNPCTRLKVPPDTKEEKIVKDAFTQTEIDFLIEHLPEKWSAAVRCAVGTYGQRIGDVLSLKWEQFDWENRIINIITSKTAEVLTQPMSENFYTWARARYEAALTEGGDAAIYVLPQLCHHSNPSSEFTKLVRLFDIGITGKGGGGRRRRWHSKTFHSIRAYVATQFSAAGVPLPMAMHLIGHESEEVHAVYIRPTLDQLREMAARIAS